MQPEIASALGVRAPIDVPAEVERRVAFLETAMSEAGASALVLGVSGGVDSATAAMLCQRAVRRRREHGGDATFVAGRLPHGAQQDEREAQMVLDTVGPDRVVTVDIAAPTAVLSEQLDVAGVTYADDRQRDVLVGNIKARQRMTAQYAIAGTLSGLVVGTDHAAEAVMGFFTKFGDGAVDVVPLSGLTKRQVRALGAHLSLPERIVTKVATADLEDLRPGRPDEDDFGITYDDIDAFLEGESVSDEVARIVVDRYHATQHKRQLPLAP